MEVPAVLDPTHPAIRPRSGKSEGACPVCSRIFSLSEISRHAHACANRAYGRAAPKGPKAPKKKAREFDNPFDPPDEPGAALGARAEGSDAGRADGAGPSSEPLKAARPKGPKGAAHRGKRGLEQGPFVPRMVKRRRLPATEYWEVERGIVVTCRKLTQETPLFAVVQAARLQQRAGPGAGLSSGPAGRLPLGASCGEAVEPGAGVAAPLPSADYVVPLGGKTGALQSAAAQMRDPALSIAAARRMAAVLSNAGGSAGAGGRSASRPPPSSGGAGALAGAPELHLLASPRPPPSVRRQGEHDYTWDDERLHFTSEEGAKKLLMAEQYLAEVKSKYGAKSETYEEFQRILTEFLNGASDTVLVMERIGALFSSCKPLAFGFNTFLPEGYRILATNHMRYLTCDGSAEATRALADGFLDQLCACLAPHPGVLRAALEAMDRLPSAGELRAVESMEELAQPPARGPASSVSGMPAELAARIHAALTEIENAMRPVSAAHKLMVELMQYVPTGLHHGLVDSIKGYTHYIEGGRSA